MKPGVIILFACALFFIATSCSRNPGKQKQLSSELDSFKTGLIEKQIDSSGFFISLPTNFTIKEADGPDFSVYYFYLSDTTIKSTFMCGLYFGNFPHKFKRDSCTVETSKGKIFNENVDWYVYKCGEDYSIQTITDNKYHSGWDEKIHAFGSCESRKEVEKVMYIFSTMRKATL